MIESGESLAGIWLNYSDGGVGSNSFHFED